jgi:hypothetical protein
VDLNTWWADDPEQRFWMETTGRADVGADLHAPVHDDSGNETPSYSLVREVRDGDVVFHYEKRERAITSWSVAHGGFWEAETVWGTPRSTGRTGHPVAPYARPGLWHGLHGPFPLPEPLTLAELRAAEATIRQVRVAVEGAHSGAVYYPFQLRGDGVRSVQGYLSKMPTELVKALPKLAAVAATATPPPQIPRAGTSADELGEDYIPVDEEAAQPDRDPFSVDPSVVERGVRSHAQLQNAVASHVAAKGFKTKKPGQDDPPWDVLWTDDHGVIWFGEVKSLTAKNEERQLRYGLGQLLRYRHRLAKLGVESRAVLVVEYKPSDAEWQELCASLDVVVAWPDMFAERL